MSSQQQIRNIKIGSWLVDSASLRLINGDTEVKLQPKLMSLLLLLASKPGVVFSRDSLTEEIWPETSATDDTINNAIGRLRKALSTDQECERYIETIPKLGYRLCTQVLHPCPIRSEFPETSQAVSQENIGAHQTKRRSYVPLVLTGMLFMVIFVITVAFILAPQKKLSHADEQISSSPDLQQPIREILISNHQESELFPSISKNGKEVVFVRIAQTMDSTQLVVKHIDDQDEIILTDKKGLYTNPIWSPDGQNIAYIEIGISGCRILSTSARGGPSQFVTNCSSALVSTLRPTLAWSPDGQYLIVPMQVPDMDNHALFRVNLTTKESEQMTFPPNNSVGDASPTFSPSGDRLAFTRTSEYFTDRVIVISTNQLLNNVQTEPIPAYFDQHVGRTLGITWLNQDTILMSSGERNIHEIWSLSLSTEKRRLLGIGGHGIIHPQFNVSHQSFVMAEMNANADIVVRKHNPDGATVISEIKSTQWERAGSLSNDKNFVGFIRLIPDGTELWIHNIEKNQTERLLKTNKFITGMTWSPNDQRLALSIIADSKMHIEVYERDTHHQYRLSITETDNQQFPIWTHDGESVIYTSQSDNKWSIWKTHVSDLKSVKLLQEGGNRVALSNNENTLYFTKEGDTGFWQFDLDSSPADLATRVSEKVTPKIIMWDYDDGYFYYVKEMRRMINTIYRFDPNTGSEIIIYEGLPFNEMDIKGDYISTSDIKEFSGDVLLRQYAEQD
jgi:DNA-binding winged helix-turn-helix (wHTH) protein/Tol biopolymer transport system component